MRKRFPPDGVTSSNTASWLTDSEGSAAVEFVLWLAYKRMLVQIAGQAAVQAAWHTCDSTAGLVPATKNCPGLLALVTTAAQATSLGTAVTTTNANVTEAYYCAAGQTLTLASGTTGSLTTPLTIGAPNCVASGHTTAAGDYIKVQVSYAYAPIFSNLSVGPFLTTPITYQAWMRLK